MKKGPEGPRRLEVTDVLTEDGPLEVGEHVAFIDVVKQLCVVIAP